MRWRINVRNVSGNRCYRGICRLALAQSLTGVENAMSDTQHVHDAILPHLEEEDFKQMRLDTLQLRKENDILKRRISHLEYHIVTHACAGWQVH